MEIQIPGAPFIEEAIDTMKDELTQHQLDEQEKELVEAIGDKATEDMRKGYNLGLMTARVMVLQSTYLLSKGIDTSKVL